VAHTAAWEKPPKSRGLAAGRKFRRAATAATGQAHALNPDRPAVTLCNRYANRFEPMDQDFESVAEHQRCKRCEERLAGATV
jgi:hypothetical protein